MDTYPFAGIFEGILKQLVVVKARSETTHNRVRYQKLAQNLEKTNYKAFSTENLGMGRVFITGNWI